MSYQTTQAHEALREKVRAFADGAGLPIVGEIPRSDDIIRFEEQGKTVIEGDPDLPVSRQFFDLARMLLAEDGV